jgi:hypothetical protein
LDRRVRQSPSPRRVRSGKAFTSTHAYGSFFEYLLDVVVVIVVIAVIVVVILIHVNVVEVEFFAVFLALPKRQTPLCFRLRLPGGSQSYADFELSELSEPSELVGFRGPRCPLRFPSARRRFISAGDSLESYADFGLSEPLSESPLSESLSEDDLSESLSEDELSGEDELTASVAAFAAFAAFALLAFALLAMMRAWQSVGIFETTLRLAMADEGVAVGVVAAILASFASRVACPTARSSWCSTQASK